MARLRKGDIKISDMISWSYKFYGNKVDNKAIRMGKDITGGKINARRGLQYNRQTKQWEQLTRDIRIEFTVKSNPKSYKRPSWDEGKVHTYPVTFLIRDWDAGLNSSFRFRSGGLSKWGFSTQKVSDGKTESEKDRIRRKNQKIQEENIYRKKLDGSFFFELMVVLKLHGLLYGADTTNGALPKKKNPDNIPYFDKHSLYIATQILPRIFQNAKLNQKFSTKQ